MRIQPCVEPGTIRLCNSCGRNPENQPNGSAELPPIKPITRGERCFDWYAAPTKPTPARAAD